MQLHNRCCTTMRALHALVRIGCYACLYGGNANHNIHETGDCAHTKHGPTSAQITMFVTLFCNRYVVVPIWFLDEWYCF